MTDIDGLRVEGLVPSRVQETDAAGHVRAQTVARRDVTGVLRDAVVDGINSLDKFLPLFISRQADGTWAIGENHVFSYLVQL